MPAAVVNRPGGGGGPFPGAISVATAPADGYTIGSFLGSCRAAFEAPALWGLHVAQGKGRDHGPGGRDVHHQLDRRGAVAFEECLPCIALLPAVGHGFDHDLPVINRYLGPGQFRQGHQPEAEGRAPSGRHREICGFHHVGHVKAGAQFVDAPGQAVATHRGGDEADQGHAIDISQHLQREPRRLDPGGVQHAHAVNDPVAVHDLSDDTQRVEARGLVRGGSGHQDLQAIGPDLDPFDAFEAERGIHRMHRLLLDLARAADGDEKAQPGGKRERPYCGEMKG